jgi:uncharacterized protein YndB with AHSA1/START domain
MNAGDQENKPVIRRRIRAARKELFDAWTDPESMREWMLPGNAVSAEVHMDARVGGELLIIIRSPIEVFRHWGQFRVVDRPSRLAFTWNAEVMEGRTTLVTVDFFEIAPDETELVLTHDQIPFKPVSERYAAGWRDIIDRLAEHLARAAQ